MVMSRTDGAPTLPILSEEEAALRELQRQSLGMGGEPPLSPQEYAARRAALMARTLGVPESADRTGMSVAQMYQQARAEFEQDGDQDKFSRAIDAIFESQRRPPPSSTDGMPGPMTGTEEDYQAYMGMTQDPLEPMRQEGRDMQNARDYGRRVGGGAPFTSEGEAQQYNQRTNLSEEQKAAMRAAGATEGEIIDAQRSQYDRDMAGAGFGWAPIYGPNGTVTYAPRAPTSPAEKPGATDQAVGGPMRVGPEVDNRDMEPDLRRPDLEARGYVETAVEGPYGPERVYVPRFISDDMKARMREDYGFTDEEIAALVAREPDAYQLATRAIKERRQKENMMARAGVSPEQGAGMNRMQLRQLIRENREAELAQRKEAARLARMNPAVRRELALEQLGDPNAEDWQRGAIADLLGFEGPTPLGVEAANMEQAYRLAGAALQGGGVQAEMDFKSRMEATMRQREGRQVARAAAAGSGQMWPNMSRAAQLARAREALANHPNGYSPEEIDDLMLELEEETRPRSEPPDAGETPPPQGQRVPARQGGGRGGRTAQPPDFGPGGAGRGRSGTLPGRR